MTVKIDGIAGLTFADNSTQNVTALNASNITSGTLGRGRMFAGAVLQMVSSVKTDSYFTTSLNNAWGDIPGQGGSGTWSVTITPNFSSSKILLLSMLTYRCDYWGAALRFVRNGTAIGLGDLVSNTFQGTIGQFWVSGNNNMTLPSHMSFLDSPATTSALTYKVQIQGNTNGAYVGRTINQVASIDNGVYPSSIIAMEVAT